MFAVDACRLPATGGSTFVVIFGLFMLAVGVIVARWARASAGHLSVVVAPLVLLGGFALAPEVTDPCAAATSTVAPATSTVASATSTVAPATSTVGPTTTTTTIALTCATGGTCTVGDTGPGGGIVFYVDLNAPSGSRYLEAACAGWFDGTCGGSDSTDPGIQWGCPGTAIVGADGIAIGSGEQNTEEIATGCGTAGIAAQLARDLVLGGQTDWFLPSKDEMYLMYMEKTIIIGLSCCMYWSSSEIGDDLAWIQNFFNGIQLGSYSKLTNWSVRPVRAF